MEDKKEYNYYHDQIDSLEDPGIYEYKIQIFGGNGSKTNHMNISKEQLEKIKDVLDYGKKKELIMTIVDGGIVQEMIGKSGSTFWINVDMDCLEGGQCPVCDEELKTINPVYEFIYNRTFPFVHKKLVKDELFCEHCQINWDTDDYEYDELYEKVKEIFKEELC